MNKDSEEKRRLDLIEKQNLVLAKEQEKLEETIWLVLATVFVINLITIVLVIYLTN